MDVIGAIFLVLVFLLISSIAITKIKLERGAKKYPEQQLSGSSIAHGMAFNDSGRGVHSRKQESTAYYRRLLDE